QRPADPAVGEAVDIAIPFGRKSWPGRRATKLFDEVACPVCSPGFLQRHRPFASTAELGRAPLLHLEAPGADQWLSWRDYLAAGEPPHAPLRGLVFNDYTLVLQAALAGPGVALGWRPLVDDMLESRRLVVALDRSLRTERGYFILRAAGSRPSRAV